MKKRTEYNINSDFDKWKNFNPPLGNRFVLWFFQKLMSLCFLKVKSDETCEAIKLQIPYGKNKKMRAVLYSPKVVAENAPCLLYFHGGGFVLPGAPHHFNNAKKYALGAGCKVLYVDYPLAPKNKFPVGVNACFDSYKWLIKNEKELSIDSDNIIVGGDSAGGNFATLVCMMAKDKDVKLPVAQMLIYPSINSGLQTTSMKTFHDTPLCNSEDCKKYLKFYIKKDSDKYKKYISPLNADSLSDFPPTYIETAEFDCLRDEARIFARKLRNSNVKVDLNNTKETMHGYDMVEDSKITLESMRRRIEFLKKYFA
ncbi:MAG: alpha/beta hydrolase [Clostridia bacterium]|nr:alpha/beta hydrolase [Clostridia bacterium]